MYHVFHAQGVVSVIIELFGGIIFLTIHLEHGIHDTLKSMRSSLLKIL
jgi:ABC-type enterochelin transport system permease subunit